MNVSISLPRSIRIDYALIGAFLLFALLISSGTSVAFGFLIFLFVILSVLTINLLGGLATLSGICVAALALRIVLIPQVAKVAFWQPADSFLEVPVVTAGVLTLGMAGFLLAALMA